MSKAENKVLGENSKLVAVKILCPECGKICNATEEHGDFPFGVYIHDCEHCGYTIMESEWDVIEDAKKFISKQSLLPEQIPSDESVILERDAIIAVDLAEQGIRDKSVDCFVHFVEDYCHEAGHWEIYKESEHYTKVFKEMLSKKP